MVSFGHTAIGVVVGTVAYQSLGQGNLAYGLLLTGAAAFTSHYIMDAIPHGHFSMPQGYKKGVLRVIIFDLFLSIILFLGLIYLKDGLSYKFLYALFGIGGSQLPDIIDGLVYTGRLKKAGISKLENDFHEKIHWHNKGDKPLLLGVRDIWQLSVVIVTLIWVYYR